MKKTLLISLCIVITLSAVFFVFLSNQPPDPDILYAAEPTQDTPSSPDIASIYAYTTYEPTESDYETPTPQALEYIPDVPTYKTKLQALISQANHQYQLAATPGAHIQSGRHHATDIQTLLGAIHHAQTILETPNTTDEDIQQIAETLHQAINTFHHTIIDTRNHYRPFLPTIAQGQYTPEKRHLRAAWIATVLNIDWPSVDARGATPAHVDLQKYELRTRFHELAELGFNAVIFQISPTGDAFFNSAMSPWAAWLTGETNFTGELLDSTGAAFDPLAYAIQLAQAHNMEFHAWFNPYRITHTLEQYAQITLSSTGQYVTDLAQIRQEWSQIPGTAFYLFGDYVKLGENRYVVDPAAP
ncbi:MAG: family 10 glycosylhydrolase, partial [Defluviitaleaceae bacterium]|nr:family 10 glycosylhydrolase [Defluviitaleaceae bacterium]